jgi:hypothetical protein
MSLRREAEGSDGADAEAAMREISDSERSRGARTLDGSQAAAVARALQACLTLSNINPKALPYQHQRLLSAALQAAAEAQMALSAASDHG